MDQRVAAGPAWDDALVDLYRAQRLPLLRLAVLLTDDPGTAEDVVQDVFVALQRRWHAVDPAAAVGLPADVGRQRRPDPVTGAGGWPVGTCTWPDPRTTPPRPTSPCC